MNDIFSIKNKVAVITGATGVLGGSIANSFVAAGARVVVLGTKQDKVDSKVADLQAAGGQVIGFACNVLDVPALEAVKNEIGATARRRLKSAIPCAAAENVLAFRS